VRYIHLLLIIMGVQTHITARTLITDIMATIDITQIMGMMATDITQIIYRIAH
jgi:hypothetical protein